MGALTLGPLVLPLDRAYAALGFAVLLLGAELLARRGRPALATWGWQTAAVTFVFARIGFVIDHLDFYLAEPGAVLAIWQGGFAPWWGVAAGAAVTLWHAVRSTDVRRAAPTLGLLAVAAWWLPAAVLTPARQASEVALPALTLAALDGAPVVLTELEGPVVVNVWATWCPPCRRELPVFFDAAARERDVTVLLVNQRESDAQVRGYLAAASFPNDGVLLDPGGLVGAALKVAGLPTTFAFDADGRMVDVHVGEISAPALRTLIERLR